jgi:hypothetical protein
MDGQVLAVYPLRRPRVILALLFVPDKMLHLFFITVFTAALCFALSSFFLGHPAATVDQTSTQKPQRWPRRTP